METKAQGLEEQIGVRGSAEIHSGKRSTLRAWVMAKTGRNAASILYIGTSELGAIYNDTTDVKLNILKANPGGLPQPKTGNGGQGQNSQNQKTETPKSIEDLETQGDNGNEDEAPKPKSPKTESPKQTPKPVPPSGNAMEDRVREIAREEDIEVARELAGVVHKLIGDLPKPKSEIDEAKVKEIVLANMPAPNPERVIVVTKNEEGENKKDLGVQHRMFPLLLKVVQAGLNPALVGPAGSGKTHAAHAVSVALGRSWELQGTCVTKTDIVGFVDAGGRYQSTPFSRSFSNGGVFLCDEMDSWSPMATLALNAALANGHTPLPTGMVNRHPEWAAIVAMNTYGQGASRQYVGRNQMDAATLNRLAFIAWDYDEALEGSMVGVATPGLGPIDIAEGGIPTVDKWVARVVAIRRACETLKVRHIVSPRATLGGVALFKQGVGQKWAEDMLIWQGLDAEQRNRIEVAAAS